MLLPYGCIYHCSWTNAYHTGWVHGSYSTLCTFDIYIIDYTFHGNLCVKSITICVSHTKKCFSFGILILIHGCFCRLLAGFDIRFRFCFGSLSFSTTEWAIVIRSGDCYTVSDCKQSTAINFQPILFFRRVFLLHYLSFAFATVNTVPSFSLSETI